MKGKNAKNMTSTHWQTDQIVWWKGSSINRQSKEFQNLIRRAYQAMFEQNERFRIALMSTRGIKLYHSQGEQNPYKTILTESEFCSVLTEMRDSYDINNNETPQCKKRLYFDMDGVLVDFESALAKQDEQTLKEYEGRYDEIPGLFGQMLPMYGAIEAVHRLNEYYDCYILSTAPWKNPSAWSDKVLWVTRYLDDVFHKRMVITHCKNLCKGDILIDDRGKNGTSEFEGEWIQFGSDRFPDWKSVLDYLLSNAE
jgi:5'(3')-deoxyribonucleotidase